MPIEVYLRAGDEHVVDDEELTEKELKGIQRKLNATCSMFIKIFRMGEDSDHIERHRANMMTNSMNPSAMKLFLKDQKKDGGVKVRRLTESISHLFDAKKYNFCPFCPF